VQRRLRVKESYKSFNPWFCSSVSRIQEVTLWPMRCLKAALKVL
jgi:hypothetical protein